MTIAIHASNFTHGKPSRWSNRCQVLHQADYLFFRPYTQCRFGGKHLWRGGLLRYAPW